MKNFFGFLVLLISLIFVPCASAVTFNVVVLPADILRVCENYYCYPEVSEIVAEDLVNYFNATGKIKSPTVTEVRRTLSQNPNVKPVVKSAADKYNLKVIYDAAHAFGSVYKGKSLLSYGDVSTLSFHATKLFHTVEGGACIVKDKDVSAKLDLIKRFGHNCDNHYCLGINGKQSEFHAGMGLANFAHIGEIKTKRKAITELYDSLLGGKLQRPANKNGLEYNYAYYPVLFESEEQLLRVFEKLNSEGVYPRRYFYPSLNKLPYLKEYTPCPVSEEISSRIACLPLFVDLSGEDVEFITKLIKEAL